MIGEGRIQGVANAALAAGCENFPKKKIKMLWWFLFQIIIHEQKFLQVSIYNCVIKLLCVIIRQRDIISRRLIPAVAEGHARNARTAPPLNSTIKKIKKK